MNKLNIPLQIFKAKPFAIACTCTQFTRTAPSDTEESQVFPMQLSKLYHNSLPGLTSPFSARSFTVRDINIALAHF